MASDVRVYPSLEEAQAADRAYGTDVHELSREQIKALRRGEVLRLWVQGGEYVMFVMAEEKELW